MKSSTLELIWDEPAIAASPAFAYLQRFDIAGFVSALAAGQNLDDRGNLVSPDAYVHPSARLERTIVGPGAEVYEFCSVRDSLLESGCRVGHGSEVARSILASGTSLPRFNYVGSSIIGERVRLGGCVSLASRRFDSADVQVGEEVDPAGLGKFGAIVGADTIIGFGAHLNPGVRIGRRCLIGPYVDVRRSIPSDKILVIEQRLIMRGRAEL